MPLVFSTVVKKNAARASQCLDMFRAPAIIPFDLPVTAEVGVLSGTFVELETSVVEGVEVFLSTGGSQ